MKMFNEHKLKLGEFKMKQLTYIFAILLTSSLAFASNYSGIPTVNPFSKAKLPSVEEILNKAEVKSIPEDSRPIRNAKAIWAQLHLKFSKLIMHAESPGVPASIAFMNILFVKIHGNDSKMHAFIH